MAVETALRNAAACHFGTAATWLPSALDAKLIRAVETRTATRQYDLARGTRMTPSATTLQQFRVYVGFAVSTITLSSSSRDDCARALLVVLLR